MVSLSGSGGGLGQLQLGQSILRVMKVNSEVAEKMSVRVTVSCKAESVRFSERLLVVEPGDFVAVGRADTNNRSDLENGYFNCKVGCQETDCILPRQVVYTSCLFVQVLSKKHAKILYKGNKVFLQDLGSTNGTYINKIRLSRPGDGDQSENTGCFNGRILH